MYLIRTVKNNFGLIFVITTAVLIVWPLFLPGYFSHHDDLQVMRVFEMKKCLQDLQIPCRWVPDMGYGNGYPLFNYYNPLPYYIGGLISFVFGYIFSVKILFFLAAILGGLSMYFLAKEIFDENAAILSAVLYQFAPYKALDLYVRGALAESFAISIIPLCLLLAIKLLKNNSSIFFLGVSLSTAAILTSHNIMTLFFIPLMFLFLFFWIVLEKSKNVKLLILSIFLGFGLSAFFIIPSFLEKNLVQIDNLTKLDLNFRAHFVTINQLFLDRSWGYGASSPGSDDTISFQIGWPHWLISFVALILALFSFKKRSSKIALLFTVIFLLSIFMTHIRSAFIWEKIGILRFVQFPWRFLAVVVFCASLLGGYSVTSFPLRFKKILMVTVIFLAIFLNWQYFKPEIFYPEIGDREKLSSQEWEKQQKAAILDYLPKGAVEPREKAPEEPILISGKAQIDQFINKSNRFSFKASVIEEAVIEVPVYDFPIWRVLANNQPISFSNNNYLGRISINLAPGDYSVEAKLTNTLTRNIANFITLLSVLILVLFIYYGKSRKIIK